MSKEATFIQTGDVIQYTAGADVAVGEVVSFPDFVGVAATAIADGATGSVNLTGVYEMAAENDTAWAIGDIVYWNESASKLTKTAAGMIPAGVAWAAKAQTAAVGYVRLGIGVPTAHTAAG